MGLLNRSPRYAYSNCIFASCGGFKASSIFWAASDGSSSFSGTFASSSETISFPSSSTSTYSYPSSNSLSSSTSTYSYPSFNSLSSSTSTYSNSLSFSSNLLFSLSLVFDSFSLSSDNLEAYSTIFAIASLSRGSIPSFLEKPCTKFASFNIFLSVLGADSSNSALILKSFLNSGSKESRVW